MEDYKGLDHLVRKGVLEAIERQQAAISDPQLEEELIQRAFAQGKVENTRMLSARISQPLFDHVEQACETIGCSKRKFVEQAMQHAVRYVDQVAEQEGLTQVTWEKSNA